MALYDIFNIEKRLTEWDSNILRIDWDFKRNLHRIICWDPHESEEYVAMTVKPGELDARTFHRMQEINPQRGYNPFDEVDAYLDAKEKADDKKVSDMARDFADVFYDPIIRDRYYS